MSKDPNEHHAAGELLADWRAAERDTLAARDAAHIAALALAAAEAAEEAATEVEAAAEAAAEAVERARSAATRARRAAAEAAEAAKTALTSAQGDQVREAPVVQPAAALHELRPEIAQVRDRAAEGGQSQSQEGQEHLDRPGSTGSRLRR